MKGSGSSYFPWWLCAAAVYLQDSAGLQLEINIKALIVLWNCPKATLANFLSFYPWWTTYNIHLVPKSEKSTFREVVGGELRVEIMHCTAGLVHEWADFSAFLYEGSICQVMSP